MSEQPFLTDIKTLRKRARQHIEQGAVTSGYGANLDTVVKLLNAALATELVCVLRYRRHHFMAAGINAQPVAADYSLHAHEDQPHPYQPPQRFALPGCPPCSPPPGLAPPRP